MNLSDVILLSVLAIIVIGILWFLHRQKAKGTGCCGSCKCCKGCTMQQLNVNHERSQSDQ